MRPLLFALLLLASPAAAQDPATPDAPLGIGFAQAEEGTWFCLGADPSEALSCARELCTEQAIDQVCLPAAWCQPARWSGLTTVWLPDAHGTQVLCGAPSEAALTAALEALCAGNEFAASCDLTRIVDPDGIERVVEGVSFAGGAPVPDAGIPAGGEVEPTADTVATDGAAEPEAAPSP